MILPTPPHRALGEVTSVAYKEGLSLLRFPAHAGLEPPLEAARRLEEAGALRFGLVYSPAGTLLAVRPDTPAAVEALADLEAELQAAGHTVLVIRADQRHRGRCPGGRGRRGSRLGRPGRLRGQRRHLGADVRGPPRRTHVAGHPRNQRHWALPLARRGGAGATPHRGWRHVLISSTAGQRGEAGHGAYAASKGAVISLVKSIAPELGPDRIRVNAVAPGWVDTDMSASALREDPAQRHRIQAAFPLQRIPAAEDLAGPVAFLLGPWAAAVTGEVLNVNGGTVLCG